MEHPAPNPLPLHPGAVLRQKLDQCSHPRVTIAQFLGLSRQTLHQILTERQAVTPQIALRLGKLTNTPAEYWLELQQARDLELHRRHDRAFLTTIPPLDERW